MELAKLEQIAKLWLNPKLSQTDSFESSALDENDQIESGPKEHHY